MANLPETDIWEDGVYQIELTDPVVGGAEGISNRQARQLANRTFNLRNEIAKIVAGTTAAGKATILATGRTIGVTGDATGTSAAFTGAANATIALTLAATGVAAGSYTKVTVDTKGRVTAGAALAAADIPALPWSKITSGTPTTLGGYGITDGQPLNANLSALAALATTGFYVNNGAGTAVARTLTAGNGISVSNGNGISGNPVVTNTGVLSLTGTANQVNVSASAGNITLSLPQAIHTGAAVAFAKVTLGADPVGAMDAVTKQYADNLAAGINVKPSVLVGTTANIALSGNQTIDGIAVPAGSRVLVRAQNNAAQNGIYITAAGAWSRSTDVDTWEEVVSAFVFIERGTTLADTGWVCTADQGGTLGTTAAPWTQFAGAGTVTGGAGITVSGNQVALSASGIAAGTYAVATFDPYGRATGGRALQASDIPNLAADILTSGTLAAARLSGSYDINISGRAATATALATGRSISVTGDATGTSAAFTGAANASIALTLANSGVTAGTYGTVTVDAKGRVTAGTIATPVANGGTGATTAAGALANLNGVENSPGDLVWTFSQTPPANTLKANGAAVLVASYANLASAIYVGNALNATAAWGYRCTNAGNPTGTRSTTGAYIVLPDMRGEGVRGFDDGRGIDAGRAWGSAQDGQAGQIVIPTRTTTYSAASAASYFSSMSAMANGVSAGTADSHSGSPSLGTVTDRTFTVNAGQETFGRNLAPLACIRY